MKTRLIFPFLLALVLISCDKKNDPKPDDPNNPGTDKPLVADFSFASDTIYLRDDSVAVTVNNKSTGTGKNAPVSWYCNFRGIEKKTNTASVSCYFSTNYLFEDKNSFIARLVVKNAAGDSAVVEKEFVLVDDRLKINVSSACDPNSTPIFFAAEIKNTNYAVKDDDKDGSVVIRIPWRLLNTQMIFAIQTAEPGNLGQRYIYWSNSFQLTKNNTNIKLTTGVQNTMTIDGVDMLDKTASGL